MRFGLISANLMGNVDGAAALETAQTAEEVGFDSLWAIEHVVVPKSYRSTYPYDEGGRLFKGASQLDHSDPLIWLAYAAGRDPDAVEMWTTGGTDRDHLDQLVELGVSQVMVPGRRPPQLGDTYGQILADYADA